MDDLKKKIRSILRLVQVPGRYMGREWNVVRKDPSRVRYRIALCYPDTYEIGMSHLGMLVLYHGTNKAEDLCAERCFAPWPDMAKKMREEGIPLFSLEGTVPLKEFDLVGFSLQHELLYTNILYMLDLAGIALRWEHRTGDDPLIIAGGSGAFTPEPMAEVFDLFVPGDGEVTLPALLNLLKRLKEEGASREEMIRRAALDLPFVYAPSLYEPRYDLSGRFTGMERLAPNAPERIRPGLVKDLDRIPVPEAPLQPSIRSVHDRITLEIMRGCTRGCRFCQAGMIKRPLRTRSPETLLEAAKAIYVNTGYDEISLCSLSSSDYPDLGLLMRLFNEHFEPLRVGLSLPSLRIGNNLKEIPGLTGAVRKAGFTLAPEAGSEDLRRRINKVIADKDLEEAVAEAYEHGWRRVKLYFMIGLPGETDEDVLTIARLSRRISDMRRKIGSRPAQVNVTVSTFVPKAHTPFQWCPMARPEEIQRKQRLLLDAGLPRRIRLNFHDKGASLVEGMLARGDRRTFLAVEEAYKRGARFDAWKEHFSFKTWMEAFQAAELDPEDYIFRERGTKERFPWDHIDPGPMRRFLWNEYVRSALNDVTPYCEGQVCNNCGVPPHLCSELKKKR